ncbi:MAG: PAS domain S-box protein [Rhodocyclaceae bacterium]
MATPAKNDDAIADPPPAASRPPFAFHHGFSTRLIAGTGIVIALVWSLLAFDLWRLHAERIEHANAQAENLVRAVEQQIQHTLHVTDQMLKLVRHEIKTKRAWKDAEALAWMLESLTPNLHGVVTVAFIGTDGISLAQSNPLVAVGRHYTSSDFFVHHSATDDDSLFIEKPIVGPASGQRIFTVSRALRDDRGELLGILNASLNADLIAEDFDKLRIGDSGSLGVHHLPSYRTIARQPDHLQTFGQSLEHRGLRDAVARAPVGTFEGEISADKVQRFFAYRKLDDLPLAVTVGIARADITRDLRQELAGYAALTLLLTLALAGGAVLILRAHRRELALKADIVSREALFKAFFDAVPAGMSTLDRNMRYRLINPELSRINGNAQDDYTGKTVQEIHPTLLRQLAPIHHEVFSSGRTFRDVEFKGKDPSQMDGFGYWRASFFPIYDADGKVDSMGCFVVEVTAQKQAEAALQHNEMLLATMLEALPVGVWVTDSQGLIIRNNPAAESIWTGKRYVAPEQYGNYKGWWVESGQPIAAADWAMARAISKGETSLRELIEIECFDGTHKTILNSAVPMRDQRGRLLGAVVVNEDVTAMQRTQEELRIARDFFEQAFDSAPVGMAIADNDGRYTKVNRAMTEFIGYSEAELLTMTYMDITHPDDLALNNRLRRGMLAGATETIRMEKRYVRKDGSNVWAIMVASAVLDKNDKLAYSIGQMLDIDRQKRAEQSLRESEARFRAIFDNASIGIAATDAFGRVGYFNEAFRSMLGYESEALVEMNFADFTHPRDLVREQQYLDEIRAGTRDHYRFEKRYLQADNNLLWVDISTAALRDENGEITNFVAAIYDISERKEAERALNTSRLKLRALSAHQTLLLEEDRKHIAREIHDELGQLLTALKMDISLLRMGFGDDPKLHEQFDRMRQLVDKTIDVVRHVASNLRPSALDLGLVAAIEWLADDFSARWEIPCSVECNSSDGVEINLDDLLSTAVFRVVQESLTNIARHARASRVSITLHRDHRMLQVFVRDNGCGFDIAAAADKKGFGLFGMRERILTVGGKLVIESSPNKGTTVTISLPLPRKHS